MSIMHNGEKVLNNLTTVPIAQTIDSTSTDKEIPSAKAVYDNVIKNKSLKTYTSLEQLGLTSPTTVGEIFNVIPDNSLVVIECGEVKNYITDTPDPYGLLTIEKIESGRFSILFKQSLGGSMAPNYLYIGQLKGADGSGLTWRRVCTTSVADSSGTVTLPDGVTGTISYKVINGTCYVSIQRLADGLTGLEAVVFTGLPKADVFISISIENSGNRAGTIYSADGVTFHVHKIVAGEGYGSFSYPVAES